MTSRAALWGTMLMAGILVMQGCASRGGSAFEPTGAPAQRVVVQESEVRSLGQHHTQHSAVHGRRVQGFNALVLLAIDQVQAKIESGGGYLDQPRHEPVQKPISYPLTLLGNPLVPEAGTGSTDTAATYAAFIETLNLIFPEGYQEVPADRLATLRIPDGRFWKTWDGPGFGPYKALVPYGGMGIDVPQEQAQPGDFITLVFKNNTRRSGVFLGWQFASNGQRQILYWSSQQGTKGFGDYATPLTRLQRIKVARLTNPDALFTFDVNALPSAEADGEEVKW